MLKKRMFIVGLFALFFVTACGSKTEQSSSSQNRETKQVISIYKFPEKTTIQDYELQPAQDVSAVLNKESDVKIFEDAINESEVIPGVVNVASPTYKIKIDKNGIQYFYIKYKCNVYE